MKRLGICALLALQCSTALAYSNITQQQAAARALQISDVNYTLSMDLVKGSETFSGENNIEFKLLHKNADVVIDFDGRQVSQMSINGKSTENFTFDSKEASIILPATLFKQGQNSVSMAFVGEFSHSGSGLHQFTDPADNKEYYYSDFEPAKAHHMFPSFDQPNLKATFRLDVEAPADWQVISNMNINKSAEVNGVKHHWFNQTLKMSTYIFHLSAGPYAMWEDYSGKYPLRIFTRQSLSQYMDPQRMFDTSKKGFAFFEDYYDYDYPFTKYDQIFVPEFNSGAMENAGAVTFGEYQLFRSSPSQSQLIERDVTILHEMAHMWFGNLVTMDWWNDLWLNESFADIMGYQGLEGIGQQGAWDRAARYKSWAYSEDQLVTTHPILSDVPDIMSASANFDGITYAKGLSALRQLQYWMGADKFKQGIRQYFKQHAFKNTTLADFIAALESVHGKALTPWVDSWLGTKDVNTMKLNFDISKGKVANASVTQTGGVHNPTLRPHANLIGLYHVEQGELRLKETVKVLFDGEKTNLPALNGKKAPAVILPNVEDHDYIKIRLDERSLVWLKANIHLVKDSPTKTMVWSTLWDMVRDQQMRASEFAQLAMTQLTNETDVYVLEYLLEQMETVVDSYTPDTTAKRNYRQQLFALAKRQLKATVPGSDLQRVWYWSFDSMAVTDADYQYLLDLYDGKKSIDGINMNNHRQWRILQRLASANRHKAVNPRMTALVEADKSAKGQNEKLTTQSFYPDASNKTDAWKKLTQGEGYSLRQKTAIIDGLYHADHPKLAKLLIKPYFDEIEAIHQRGERYEYASYFIRKAFPGFGLEDSLLATEQFLRHSKVPTTYKKQVMRQMDTLQRTLKVRQMNQLTINN